MTVGRDDAAEVAAGDDAVGVVAAMPEREMTMRASPVLLPVVVTAGAIAGAVDTAAATVADDGASAVADCDAGADAAGVRVGPTGCAVAAEEEGRTGGPLSARSSAAAVAAGAAAETVFGGAGALLMCKAADGVASPEEERGVPDRLPRADTTPTGMGCDEATGKRLSSDVSTG